MVTSSASSRTDNADARRFGSLNHVDIRVMAAGEPLAIAGHDRCIERLGKRDVGCVVRGQVPTKTPDPRQQRVVRMSDQRELAKIFDRVGGSRRIDLAAHGAASGRASPRASVVRPGVRFRPGESRRATARPADTPSVTRFSDLSPPHRDPVAATATWIGATASLRGRDGLTATAYTACAACYASRARSEIHWIGRSGDRA